MNRRRIGLLAAAGIVLAAFSASAAPRIWTVGGTDYSWGTANNWTPAGAPASTDLVMFANDGLGRTNILDQDRTVVGAMYTNISPTLCQLTDLGGNTLTLTNLYVGSLLSG